jgi:UPF0755 protein
MAKKSNVKDKNSKKSRNNSLIHKILIALAFFLIIGGLLCGYIAHSLFSPNISVENDKKEYLLVYENECYDDILSQLENKNLLKSVITFKTASWILNSKKEFKPGRYQLSNEMNNLTLIRNLIYGRQTPISISFNNVRTKEILAERITKKLKLTKEEFLQELNSASTLENLGLNKNTIVCLFIPNTYEVYWDITADELIERMKKEYDKFWTEERTDKLLEVGLTKEEVSTLASIVEEETKKADEQPIVAGLYLNRIHKNIPLQADPTVKFAVQDFSLRRIYKKHLEYDSPYNTYKYAGLPPGPIRIPSIQAIDAVLNFKNHNYIYMCAKEDFSGYHNFATTYKEHQDNAEKYRRALNRRGIR